MISFLIIRKKCIKKRFNTWSVWRRTNSNLADINLCLSHTGNKNKDLLRKNIWIAIFNHNRLFFRFLCKLKEAELLEPLMPTIRSCLEHRHSYVRRNAVMAIFTIYKNFDFLIPDAPELIANFLDGEQVGVCF